MNDSKQWYQSKTVWSSIVVVLASLLTAFGVGMGERVAENQSAIVEVIMSLVGAVAGAVAFWGRMTADTKIEKKSE